MNIVCCFYCHIIILYDVQVGVITSPGQGISGVAHFSYYHSCLFLNFIFLSSVLGILLVVVLTSFSKSTYYGTSPYHAIQKSKMDFNKTQRLILYVIIECDSQCFLSPLSCLTAPLFAGSSFFRSFRFLFLPLGQLGVGISVVFLLNFLSCLFGFLF